MRERMRNRGSPILTAVALFGVSTSNLWAQDTEVGGVQAGEISVGSRVEMADGKSGTTDWIVSVIRQMQPSLSGRVTVPAPKESMIDSAELTWRVDGAKISGTVQDADGKMLATFEGTATTGRKVEGTFTTSEGEVGPWSWEGSAVGE
jgi:hypothetical protein